MNSRGMSRYFYIFWIFFRYGVTVPIFINIGYLWKILGGGAFLALPIREQPRKGPSWIRLRIEGSVCAFFFKILFFKISFSNAKLILISLERLTIELYLYIKICLDYFPGRLKYAKLRKSMHLTFWVLVTKFVEVIP